MADKFLDKAYSLETPEDTRKLYDAWSGSYDDEVGEHGYATPGRIAAALAKHTSLDAPVLDFGCGTGLCGISLRDVGFTTVDGNDISPEMLRGAAEKGIYRKLWQIDPDAPPTVSPGDYAAIVACGVIGVGAAPLSVFDELMGMLTKDGVLAFSFNDHALADRAFEAKVNEWVDCGAARLLFREYGAHLPGADLKSMVYILEKK